MNTCIISGMMGKDPTVNTVGEYLVANFSVAVRHRWRKNDQGERISTWFKVSAWGKLAETVRDYIGKGCMVAVEGEIEEPDNWTDRNTGLQRVQNKIRASSVEVLKWPPKQEAKQAPASAEEEEAPF